MNDKKLPIACPLCGRKNYYALDILHKGSVLTCTFCWIQLTLHGHMWEAIRTEIDQLREE